MMTTLVKIVLAICLSHLSGSNEPETAFRTGTPLAHAFTPNNDSIQFRALEILNRKCNVCHMHRNRRRVFTDANMGPWADAIYTQVFLKKRMPKGKRIKLDSEEYQDLLTWISTLKNKSHGNQL